VLESRVIGGKCDDPVVLIRKDADRILCDCGRIDDLAGMGKVKIILISHAHLDHFSGFDDIFRQQFGSGKDLQVYGPRGITRQVFFKINAYTWNVAEPDSLHVTVHEITGSTIKRTRFSAMGNLEGESLGDEKITGSIIYSTDTYFIRCIELDHKTPVLAYRISEYDKSGVNRRKLNESGLAHGPWLRELKERALDPDHERIVVEGTEYSCKDLLYLLKEKKGDSVVYMVDFTPVINYEEIVAFARDAGVLYCESYFSEKEEDLARENHHLTSKDAALLGRDSGAKRLVLLHFSNRYRGDEESILAEAGKYYENVE
jgi:ribonuclease Z